MSDDVSTQQSELFDAGGSTALNEAKPFLKWAGGKTQLLDTFEELYPPELKSGTIQTYMEPFVGGGAVFFDLAGKYGLNKAWLSDINRELMVAYMVVQRDVENLVGKLSELARGYKELSDEDDRKAFYYRIRDEYNEQRKQIDDDEYSPRWVRRAAMLVFMNRTCFNGLFRLNKKGEFNVPHGSYKNPTICDEQTLRVASRGLDMADLHICDFTDIDRAWAADSFIYFDPPYRPLSETSGFTSYSRHGFDDDDQRRLAALFEELNGLGAKLMLSNSDPKNTDPEDDFFDDLYSAYNIHRVSATRAINCDASGRGEISELVITNY